MDSLQNDNLLSSDNSVDNNNQNLNNSNKNFKGHKFANFLITTSLIFLLLIITISGYFYFNFKNKKISNNLKNVSDLFSGFSKLIINSANAKDNFTLKPEKVDSLGINPDSTYLLSSKEEVNSNLIKNNIKIEPEIEYNVTEISKKEWKISLKENLLPNTLVKISLASSYSNEQGEQKERDYSWVFQVKDSFKIINSIPRNSVTGVPINTGIEFTLSHENFINYENYFSISPKVPGKFEKHGRTLVFVPTETLKEGSLYTAILKKGLPLSDSEETLSEDYVINFETEGDNKSNKEFYLYNQLLEITPQIIPIFQIYSNNNKNIEASIYQFNNWDNFYSAIAERDKLPWWSYSKENFLYDITKLNFINKYSLEPKKEEYKFYLEFPNPLPIGFYLIEFTDGNRKQQAWLQVSNLSVYSSITETDTIFWVNNAKTKKNVEGAQVELLNNNSKYSTKKDGIITFPTPEILKSSANDEENYKRNYFKVSKDNEVIILAASPISRMYNWIDYNNNENYWKYIYTDRPRYQTTDVIKFWGFLKSREGNNIKEKITVSLNKEGYVDYYYQPVKITEQEITLNNDTFNGEIKIENVRPDYYTLEFKIGDTIVGTKYINIMPYVKPAYQLSLTPEKKYAFADETVKLKGKASFFEGTPVPDLKLIYKTPEGEKAVTTDENGEVNLTYVKKYFECKDSYSCWPEYEYITLRPEDSELAEITAETNINYYGPKVYLETKEEYPKSGQGVIHISTKFIDLDLLSLNKGYYWRNSLGDKPSPNTKVIIEATKIKYISNESGTQYDFINKKTYKTYTYSENRTKLDSKEIYTNNNGKFDYVLDIEPETSYEVKLKVFDNDGKYDNYTRYLYYYNGKYFKKYTDWRYNYYHLEVDGGSSNNNNYDIGDNVSTKFLNNDEPMPSGEGKYLFMQLQRGLREYKITDNYNYNFTFEKNDIPNINLAGVYFNGISYISAQTSYWGRSISYDYNKRNLNIEINTNKKLYKPGEKVNLSIKVKDLNNAPVKANLNLNLVDEAYYSVANDFASPLETLFANVGSGVLMEKSTHEDAVPSANESMGAEKGGCFTAGTMILMSDGSQKGIEKIKVGDKVKTFSDPINKVLAEGKVVEVWRHTVGEYMIINDLIKVTPVHQIYSNNHFIDAGKLKIGDWLLNSKGEKEIIKKIEKKFNITNVFNIHIEPQNTFFADGIYVHNQEKGGGAREFFTDAALFQSITTDNSGYANVNFTLPDNITSWRVTAQAISDELYAGINITKIPVSLPVFAEVTIGNEYLIDDKPIAKMRAYGINLKNNDDVNFNVITPELSNENKILNGKAFQPIFYNLPELKFGKYNITYNLDTKKGKDAVKLPINIISSRLEIQKAKNEKLSLDTKITAENNLPMTIVLSDQGQNILYNPLLDLSWEYGSRVDQILVRILSGELIKKYYDENNNINEKFNFYNYQTTSGGITLLPYSSEELQLSAKIASLGAPKFDKESLAQFFFNILENNNSNREEISYALSGLASLKKPVLLRLEQWLKRDDLSALEKLYLAQALYDLGDKEKSNILYLDIMSKYGEKKDPYIIVKVSKVYDEVFQATALASVLAASLNSEDSPKLFNYLIDNQDLYSQSKNSENLFNIEKYNYINQTLPKLKPSPSHITYNFKDEDYNINLTGGKTHNFILYPNEVNNLKFTKVEGDVGISTRYIVPIDLKNVKKDDSIAIKREYYVKGDKTNSFNENDTIEVRIYPIFYKNAIKGDYQITDILPSGLMPITKYYYSGYMSSSCLHWYPFNTDNQKIKYSINLDYWLNKYCAGNYFYYTARVKNKGEFKGEPAVIQSFINPEIINYSEEETITIK